MTIEQTDFVFQPGTVKPESDYEEMDRLGRKLGIPVPQMFITLDVHYPDGSKGEHYHDRSRTFNRNFWNYLYSQWTNAASGTATFGAGYLALKQINNTVTAQDFSSASRSLNFYNSAGAGVDTVGIVVGTGNTAESFDHNALVAQCLHGTTSGKFSHGAMSVSAANYTAGSKTWQTTLTRVLTNNSGSTITVYETGLYGYENSASPVTVMFERSLLSSSVAVANTGTLTITYTMTLTFPA